MSGLMGEGLGDSGDEVGEGGDRVGLVGVAGSCEEWIGAVMSPVQRR